MRHKINHPKKGVGKYFYQKQKNRCPHELAQTLPLTFHTKTLLNRKPGASRPDAKTMSKFRIKKPVDVKVRPLNAWFDLIVTISYSSCRKRRIILITII